MTRSLLAVFFICAAFTGQAQTSEEEIRITEVFRKTPLAKSLKTIETKYNVRIAYDHALVQNVVVALKLTDLTLSQSLEKMLAGTSLDFQKVGNNIVIVAGPKKPVEAVQQMNIRLSGSVLDGDTEETLPMATIQLPGTTIATTTNNDGYFTILNIPYDTCTVEIRYLGYLTQKIRVKDILQPDQFTIRLKSDTRILNEVVVLDEYNQAVHIEEQPGTSVFNPSALTSLPSLAEQDISRTLQLIPGVTSTDESSSGMYIRGSHPSYNLTLLDGMTIYQQDHFFGSFSIINADIIKDVRVHKGMFDAKYGGRASGVIDITTKNGNAVRPAYNVKMNFINAKAMVEIPIAKKWSLFVAGRRSFTDVAQTKLFNSLFDLVRISNDQIGFLNFIDGLGNAVAPQYYFFDANTKLTFKPSTRDIVSLSYYVSRDKMNIVDSMSFGEVGDQYTIHRDELVRWGNNGLSLRWGRQWNEKFYSNVRVSHSTFYREYDYLQAVKLDDMGSLFAVNFENSIADLSYAIDNEWTLRDDVSVAWGLSGSQQKTNLQGQYSFSGDDVPPEETTIGENDHSWLHGLYGSVTISPTSRLTTTAGGRVVYYYNQEGKPYLEPRLNATYKLTEELNLKTGYGRANQFLTQLFYYSTIGTISSQNENVWMLSRYGDARYPVISSDHVSTGATLKREQIVYDAEVYYKVSRGVIIDEDLNSGTTNTYGLDVMVQKVSGIHRGWIAYSLASATQQHPYILDGQRAPSWQDQRHEVKVVDMLMLGNWNLSSTVIYGSGKPYPKYTVRYLRDDSDVIYDYDLLLDYSNKSRLPAYFRIDLAASYRIHFKNNRELQLGLSIHNITDHANIKTRKINTDKLDEAKVTNVEVLPTYSDIVLLGFSPTLSVNLSL